MPRIYVGTYAKYNNGSIAGAWLDLEDYSDRDAFLAACRDLHKDEEDPELMFQDFEGFPKSFYSESSYSSGTKATSGFSITANQALTTPALLIRRQQASIGETRHD